MPNDSTTTPTIFSVVTQHLDPVASGVGDFDKRVTVAVDDEERWRLLVNAMQR